MFFGCSIYPFFGKKYVISDNLQGIKYIDFNNDGENVKINIYDGWHRQTISAKCNEYTDGTLILPGFRPSLYGLCPIQLDVCKYSCYISECTDNTLSIHIRYRNATQSDVITFTISGKNLEMKHTCRTTNVPASAAMLSGEQI